MKAVTMKEQRDQALACMWLAAGIMLATLISAFGKSQGVAIQSARRLLSENVQLQKNVAAALRDNRQALIEARAVIDHLTSQAH